MNSCIATATAALRYRRPSLTTAAGQYPHNPVTARCYGSSTGAAIDEVSRASGVMALCLAIVRVSACPLRQAPTSNRWGTVVGWGRASIDDGQWARGLARRRVFAVRSEGWDS